MSPGAVSPGSSSRYNTSVKTLLDLPIFLFLDYSTNGYFYCQLSLTQCFRF